MAVQNSPLVVSSSVMEVMAFRTSTLMGFVIPWKILLSGVASNWTQYSPALTTSSTGCNPPFGSFTLKMGVYQVEGIVMGSLPSMV